MHDYSLDKYEPDQKRDKRNYFFTSKMDEQEFNIKILCDYILKINDDDIAIMKEIAKKVLKNL